MAQLESPGPLASVEWLKTHLEHPQVIVLDASVKPVTAAASVAQRAGGELRIPSTQIFDLDKKFSDTTSHLPHTMPSAKSFEREVRLLGIHPDSIIIVYDDQGVYSSPRARWMFKAMGHEQVSVLDGGLPAWLRAGLTCQRVQQRQTQGNFVARPQPGYFCDADQVMVALEEEDCAVIDARSDARFNGREPEPRPGLRCGHMPHAINIPFSVVLDHGHLQPIDKLTAILTSKLGQRRKLIMTCGSGLTACVVALAAELCDYKEISIYDGSWSEWGLPSERPVVMD